MSIPFIAINKTSIDWQKGIPYFALSGDLYFKASDEFLKKKKLFIETIGLIPRWQKNKPEIFAIGDTNFNCGLKFLLTWTSWLQHAPKTAKLFYFSSEENPLSFNDLKQFLALWPEFEPQSSQFLDQYPILTPGFHQLSFDQGRINLTLMLGDRSSNFKQLLLNGDSRLELSLQSWAIDAWYIDEISIKNIANFNDEFFTTIALLSKRDTTLACSVPHKNIKKSIKKTGFQLTKISNKDIFTANFRQAQQSMPKPLTPWYAVKSLGCQQKRAIIIGSGLAGCTTAFALAKRNWQVCLIDSQQVGEGASGNRQAVLYPQLSAFRSPVTEFMLTAFLYAHQFYKQYIGQYFAGELKGSLQLACTTKEQKLQARLKSWLTDYPELGYVVNSKQASELAGLAINRGGLFIPQSGWIDSHGLCQFMASHKNITLYKQTSISQFVYQDQQWKVGDLDAEVLIIANGYQANQFVQTAHLPLKAIVGQMTFVKSSAFSQPLKYPLCGSGHLLPANNNYHLFGATYRHDHHFESQASDDQLNLNRLNTLLGKNEWLPEIADHWTGVRAVTPDYLPLVGPVAIESAFMQNYASLVEDAKRYLPLLPKLYPHLYVCAGFGSRGLTSIPLCGEWLAAQINGEPNFMPSYQIKALSPSRFMIKKITKNFKDRQKVQD